MTTETTQPAREGAREEGSGDQEEAPRPPQHGRASTASSASAFGAGNGNGFSSLERQWSTSNVGTYGELVPGFGTASSSSSSSGGAGRVTSGGGSPHRRPAARSRGGSNAALTWSLTTGGAGIHGLPHAHAWGSDSIGSLNASIADLHVDDAAPSSSSASSSLPSSSALLPDSGGSAASSSALHDAARITNWRTVKSLALSRPDAARYAGPDRWTALHHACSRRCPYAEVVDALFRAYPDALELPDEKGWTPLHHACRFKAPRDVVSLLLRTYPARGRRAASMREHRGRSALYYALRYDAPDGVVEMLLEADPTAVLDEDRDGVSPLSTVWDKYATMFNGKRMLHELLRPFEMEAGVVAAVAASSTSASASAAGPPPSVDQELPGKQSASSGPEAMGAAEQRVREAVLGEKRDKKLREKWDKANMLLRAAFRFPIQNGNSDDEEIGDGDATPKAKSTKGHFLADAERGKTGRKRKWRILHATSAIKCHTTLFLLSRALFPEQAFELDENDLLPPSEDGPLSATAAATDAQPSNRTALHFAAMSPSSGKDGRTVIRSLLALHPDAAQMPDGVDGSLPLHLIAENEGRGHWVHDGARDVCLAFEGAAREADAMGRTPLHRAAGTHTAAHAALPALAGPPTSQPTPAPPAAAPAATAPAATAHAPTPAPAPVPSESSAVDVGSVIQNLVDLYPSAASIADSTGRLPLHYVAEHGESWSRDAESILSANADAARARAGDGALNRLPLHFAACSPDARLTLIRHLVAAHPRGASQADRDGRLPLHLACESGKAWNSGVAVIHDAYPRALSQPEGNDRGWTCLHMAAASPGAGAPLLSRLAELYPEAASVPDRRGRFPLHCACATGKEWEGGVRDVYEANASIALAEDAQGRLPFHVAALRCCEGRRNAEDAEALKDHPTVLKSSSFAHEDSIATLPSVQETGTLSEDDLSMTIEQSRSDRSADSESRGQDANKDSIEDMTKINVLFQLLTKEPSALLTG